MRKKPPEGFVGWGEPTFERLVAAEPEPLTSSFAVSHAMLLNVIDRPGDAFAAMRHLLTDNHEDRAAQRRHIRRAIAIYRALLAGGVVERLDRARRAGPDGPAHRRPAADFALNQPLSPFALAALELLDRESPTYALDVVSVIESTLDDPRQVLSAQQFKARGEAVAQMKADGIEYEERMELLEEVTYPKPLAELLDATPTRSTGAGHPWVADHELQPEVGRPRHVRAGDDVRRVRRLLRPGPLRGPGAALPRRRLQGAAPDRARGRQDRGADRPHRVARRAGPPGRLQPARRVGASCATPPT